MANVLSKSITPMSLIVAAVLRTSIVIAAEQSISFNIPPQALGTALNAYADIVNVQLSYPSQLTAKLKSPGVTGQLTPQQALQKLLAGSGLIAISTKNGTITLERVPVEKPQSETTLPVVSVAAKRDYEDEPTGYQVTHSSVGTKTDTPIMETPLNIQIIPQQVMKDQQAVRIDKAVENVSGVNFINQAASGSSFNIRGFDTLSYYRDGVRVDTQVQNTVFPDVSPLEQIQVLKGPASILYGRIEPGGLVNLISKQPLATPYYSFQQQFGSFDFYRTTLDATGPVSKNNSLLYRLNLAYENAGSFNQFANNNRVALSPTLHWDISDKTKANFRVQYLHSYDAPGGYLPAVGNRPADVPRGTNLGEPGSHTYTDDVRVGFDWSHAFNENWTLQHIFSTNIVNNPQTSVSPQVSDCTSLGCSVSRSFISSPTLNSQVYYTSLNLTGKINTWQIPHSILMGWDYLQEDSHQAGLVNSSVPIIDLYNPVHTGTAGLLDNPDSAWNWKFGESWHGLYLQDQVKLPYHVSVLAGFRYDMAQQSNQINYIDYTAARAYPSQDKESVSALKPRFGLVWQPLQELSIYGNYVENFGLTNGHNVDGSLLAPTTAEQKEIGIKTELFDKGFIGSLAWFDLTKHNIATPSSNPLLAAQGVSSTTGEVNNKGLELDLSGEVYPGLKLIGSYAYINSQITKDVGVDWNNLDTAGNPAITIGNQGRRYYGVPKHGGSFWATYELQKGSLRGLKFGAGTVARGQREGDNANSYQIPGYAIFNLMTSYSWKLGPSKLSLQLNADNLLDKTYYNPYSGSSRYFTYATPRTFLGSIRLEF